MVRQQVKSASPWVCMFMWWVIWRDTTVLGQVCVCVCVPVSNGCSYAIWQVVFYGKSNLGDFVALPDQLNDLWASLIELDSSPRESSPHSCLLYFSRIWKPFQACWNDCYSRTQSQLKFSRRCHVNHHLACTQLCKLFMAVIMLRREARRSWRKIIPTPWPTISSMKLLSSMRGNNLDITLTMMQMIYQNEPA